MNDNPSPFEMGAGAVPAGEAGEVRSCRECGCTERNACTVRSPFGGVEQGCAWAEPDLCTGCAHPETLVRGPVGGGALFREMVLTGNSLVDDPGLDADLAANGQRFIDAFAGPMVVEREFTKEEIADFQAKWTAADAGKTSFTLVEPAMTFQAFLHQPPRTVCFCGPQGVVLTMHLDPFRIEISEGKEVDAATQVFVDQVSRLAGGSAAWRTDFERAPTGQANPVDLATYDPKTGEWDVCEAWFNAAEDAKARGEEGWWWAGTSPGDYHSDLIINGIVGTIVAWRRKPRPPTRWPLVERFHVHTEADGRFAVRDGDQEDDAGRALAVAWCPDAEAAARVATAMNAATWT